jgi:hypothetical protein
MPGARDSLFPGAVRGIAGCAASILRKSVTLSFIFD